MFYKELAYEILVARGKAANIKLNRKVNSHINGERFVLQYLSMHGEKVTPKQISCDMVVSTARMAALLKSMESKGWVKREHDPDNGRQTIVRLLPKGKNELERETQSVVSCLSSIMKKLGPEDSREYVRIEKRIAEIIMNSDFDII